MDEEISKLFSEHLSLTTFEDGTKVKCKLSGHEMPCKRTVIESYISGTKYKRLKAKVDLNIDTYMYHLVPDEKSKQKGKRLYCKLTGRKINNNPNHIDRHVQGRRFKKALHRWEECQKTGQVFKPRQPLFPKNKAGADHTQEADGLDEKTEALWENPEEDEQDNNADEDLADLYPDSDDSDIADSASDVSDFEFEELEHRVQEAGDSLDDGRHRVPDVTDTGSDTGSATGSATSDSDVETETNTTGKGSKRKQVKDHQFSKKVKVENKTVDVLKTKATKLSKKKKLKAK